jgi:protein-disulfide isomerase
MTKRSKAEERAAKAAAAMAERKRRERRRNILAGLAVVVVMALIVGIGFLVNRSRDEGGDEKAADTSRYELAIGPADAPHTIVIYEDFLCPICGQLEQLSHEPLARLAEEGKVRVSYRPFNLFQDEVRGPYSVAAASAFAVVLEKAGEDVAKKFHDLLYAADNQPSEGGPFPDTDWFVDLAVQAGATEADVRPGIEDGEGKEWVEGATKATAELGINSTPTVFLDGSQFQDYRTMEDLARNLVAAVS